jgi:cell division septation protein DedD
VIVLRDFPPRRGSWTIGLRLLAAGLLGVVVALALVACGGSGKGLIPIADAGPLQSDFEAIAQAAQTGGGDCTATTEAINKTEQDFAALPATIDPGLHRRLREGISNLRERALALCAQPLAQTATTTTPRTTSTATTTTTTPTTPAATQTTTTPTTPATPSRPTPPDNGGGTVAPGEGERSAEGRGDEQDESGGVAPGASGQEGGK